ncbi:MAG: AAA family ATPase [Defluviitaleaceae bacterium]|nr:AAA family ATPase [Defluviitaleaceae bacterium]
MVFDQEIKYINMAEVQSEEIKWLWYPYIPYGKLTIMHGDGGCGKTFASLAIASALTKGELLPEAHEPIEKGNVIFQTAEDGLSDTIKPRLEQLGADCSRIVVIDESKSPLSLSDERLEKAIIDNRAKLLIIDPIQAYLGSKVDMHRANEVRPVLKKIGGVAERTGYAVVLIGHLNKGGGKSQYRGLGSIDIVAAARSVLTFGRVNDDGLRAFAQGKANLAPEGDSIAFEMTPGKGFKWIGTYDVSIDTLLGNIPAIMGRPSFASSEAVEFLRAELADGREVLASEIYEMAENAGISERTLKRAKKELGAKAFRQDQKWYWRLCDDKNMELNRS